MMAVIPRASAALILAIATVGSAAGVARSQGPMAGMPASAVMAHGVSDGWHSRGGVVGPWWSGSAATAGPPAADGGFWFGLPGLGFGGSQGATRGIGADAPSVTTMSGAPGMMSTGRLVPFVTGVVPVVGNGFPVVPVTTGPVLPWTMSLGNRTPAARPVTPAVVQPRIVAGLRPSSGRARDRARLRVAAGDRHLLDGQDGPAAARSALGEYRAAARFAQDDADIHVRQAILHHALDQRRDTELAIARATSIDGRLAAPLGPAGGDAGFLAAAAPGPPALAARGEAILREIAGDAGDSQPPVLVWLRKRWRHRWDGTSTPVARDEPPRR